MFKSAPIWCEANGQSPQSLNLPFLDVLHEVERVFIWPSATCGSSVSGRPALEDDPEFPQIQECLDSGQLSLSSRPHPHPPCNLSASPRHLLDHWFPALPAHAMTWGALKILKTESYLQSCRFKWSGCNLAIRIFLKLLRSSFFKIEA